MKSYTISEIDQLRSTVRRRTRLAPVEVEAQVQTYMMAGITAADLIQHDEAGRENIETVVMTPLKDGKPRYIQGAKQCHD